MEWGIQFNDLFAAEVKLSEKIPSYSSLSGK